MVACILCVYGGGGGGGGGGGWGGVQVMPSTVTSTRQQDQGLKRTMEPNQEKAAFASPLPASYNELYKLRSVCIVRLILGDE